MRIKIMKLKIMILSLSKIKQDNIKLLIKLGIELLGTLQCLYYKIGTSHIKYINYLS